MPMAASVMALDSWGSWTALHIDLMQSMFSGTTSDS